MNNKINIEVLFENEDLLFINKPAGLVVHAGIGTTTTLADWILEKYPNLKDVGEKIKIDEEEIARPGIVHRLDKDTSGVMVIAKNQETFLVLKKLFQKGKIKKEYRAFVYGAMKRKRGTISRAIGKSKSDFRKQTVRNPRGKIRQATTEFVVLSESKDKSFSFVSFHLKTGRMHQIRVHSQSLQHPIICDDKYASTKPCLLNFNRPALHSYRISIDFYKYDEPITIIAPYPKDFQDAIESIKEESTNPNISK